MQRPPWNHRGRHLILVVLLLLAGACTTDQGSVAATASATTWDGEPQAAISAAVLEAAPDEPTAETGSLAEVQAALAAASTVEAEDSQPQFAVEDEPAQAAAALATDELPAGEPATLDAAGPNQPNAGGQSVTERLVEVSSITASTDLGRDIIYQGWVTVEAPDVPSATQRAITIIQGLGGYVFSQQTEVRPGPFSEIVFKVLPEDFSTALTRLSEIGELVNQQITADDVTERILDLGSRILTIEASVRRLRGFLETATNLENVAFYEQELLVRETELERLRGQVRSLQNQVALATITLTIHQLPDQPVFLPNTGLLVTVWVSTGGEDPCLGVKDLVVERDDTVDFCVEVANQGEIALTDVKLSSDVLQLDEDSFVIERGNFDQIDPGQLLTATLTAEITRGRLADRIATRGLEVLIEATATPMDPQLPELAIVTDRSRVVVTAQETIPNTGILLHAWVSGKDHDPCLGAKEVTVRPDNDTVNFCVFVGNPGDVPITDIEIRSPALDFETHPLQLEHGDFGRIDPRQFLTATLAAPVSKGRLNGRVATRGLDIEIEADALPVDSDGAELGSVTATTSIRVTAEEILPDMDVNIWAAGVGDDPCLGERTITLAPEADLVNLCLEIGNVGEIPLTDLVVTSTSLQLDANPFVAEAGDFARLEPGQFLTATLSEPIEQGRLAGRIATRGISVPVEVTATPVEIDGARLGEISGATAFKVTVPNPPPDEDSTGFSGALDASFEALAALLRGAAVVLGALIPFTPVIALLILILWWRRRRRRSHLPSITEAAESNEPHVPQE